MRRMFIVGLSTGRRNVTTAGSEWHSNRAAAELQLLCSEGRELTLELGRTIGHNSEQFDRIPYPSRSGDPLMTTPTKYPVLAPYLTVEDAGRAIEFYKSAFGAVELFRLVDPKSGKIGHAELTISGQLLMLADEYPQYNKSPKTLGGSATKFSLLVPNADAACEQAIAQGATSVMPPNDQFYGHRSGSVRDPFGHEWMLWHEVEVVQPDEMQRRWNEMVKPS